MELFPLEKFFALVEVDRSLIALDKQIADLAAQIGAQELARKIHQEGIERCHTHEREKRKAVDACELRMKEMDQERSAYVGKLEAAQTEKEYHAFKGAVDRIKAAQHDLEAELLAVWKDYESAQADTVQREKEFKQHVAVIDSVIQEKMQKIAALEDEKKLVLVTRAEKQEVVPAEWLERYSTMQQRVADPVVPVENGACSACFYSVLNQDMLDLQKRKLLQCKDCFRLLYLPELLEILKAGRKE